MTDHHTLVVSEVFGPTHQGEGPHAGRLCAFVRLMGCNLTCSWCDTPYTWDASRFNLQEQGKRRAVTGVYDELAAMRVPLVVLSGGEPLLHQHTTGWLQLVSLLSARHELHVETNGTVLPDVTTRAAVRHFTVSPKLPNSGVAHDKRVKPTVIEAFAALAAAGRACFKYVCRDAEDVERVASWSRTFELPREQVWVMPEGATAAELLKSTPGVTAAAAAHGFNLSSRLHVLAYDDARGV